MKVNWGTLGITIGLILVAVSIFSILVMGLMVGERISRLEEQIPIIKTGIKRTIIAQGYASSKAGSEKRAITFEDLKEGYALANKL